MNTLLLATALLFPTVHGQTVATPNFVLPRDVQGRVAIVLVIFNQDQRIQADSWLPLAQDIVASQPDITYKVVSASNFNDRLTRATVDAYYNFGEQDPGVHENTVLLNASRRQFMRDLHLPTTQTIYTLLLDQNGYVRWRAAGVMTPRNGEALKEAVALLGKS